LVWPVTLPVALLFAAAFALSLGVILLPGAAVVWVAKRIAGALRRYAEWSGLVEVPDVEG
jgi:hypothetical protein